jgi:hypothetical protein
VPVVGAGGETHVPATRHQDVEIASPVPTYLRAAPVRGRNARSDDVKYLLMIYLNPTSFEALSEEERDAIFGAHDEFQAQTGKSGELVGFVALADPSNSKTVRVRNGVPAITDGPYVEAKEFLAGYYIVDCDSVERANELAAQIPDARYTAIEVRPVMNAGGEDM